MEEEILHNFKNDSRVVLAHYYVNREIQKKADYIGDSFYLAQLARKLQEEHIIVAGVYFMAESVKILNPKKRVYLVRDDADCPMAHMVRVERIKKMREEVEDLSVVCYINSTAEIKAYSDICVTSSNAVKVVKKLPEKNIFFIPDGNLANYVAKYVPEKNIIANDGYCPVHNKISAEEIIKMKSIYKGAPVLAHPECREEVLELADYVGSTSGIIEETGLNKSEEFIIVTERGIEYELQRKYPNKKFHFVKGMICADMKKLTLEQAGKVAANKKNEVFVDSDVAMKAKKPLERMLELGV
ncbi:quinolinate synthase NadA [Anaerosphaera multitolerans]|uniref:Quinolinate synthase n=1 Tax=Anaerosphaera multitolerans TaxID=2487351 RepID=A0A437S5K8_9FIRM|nr:quinolinate synthase NadA [Anaerosphaera multitolerans]RVU54300.1 quinolinate synthase NadA [Anaerosphaera multitolerans]